MPFRTLDQAGDLQGMRALVRVDFNTPVENGRVSDDTRLRAALPTIRFLSERGARVVLVAHFGRPKGQRRDDMSLRVVAEPLSALLEQPVAFGDDCVGATAKAIVEALGPGGVALLENLRFHPGEEANDAAFAAELAALGDLYVDDAFSAAHRAHASVEAITHLLPSYAGLAMTQELEALDRALGAPVRPVMGIVGGSKVSSKIDLLENLVGRLDQLAIGGGMANTFLAAQGREVGDSLYEPDLLPTARTIMQAAEAAGCVLLLPMDVVCATALEEGAGATVRGLDAVGQGEKIFDAGPQSVQCLRSAMDASATVIWNGPLGVFEVPPFDAATTAAARHAAERCRAGKLVAVAGGGDTVAALNHAGVAGEFTFVSTAGGAFLEWMEGKTLPGVAALERAGD